MVEQYSRLRPLCNSLDYIEPVWGFNRGDPHITTIDGNTYSFNGHCEYHMIRNSSDSVPPIEFQARTGLATLPGSNVTSGATVFTGFALKAGSNNNSIAVLYNSTTHDLDVYRGKEFLGSVLSYFYGKTNATTIELYTLTSSDNRSITISDSSTGFSVTVTRVLNFLQTVMQLDPDRHGNGIEGLMGNFNGNTSDEYKMRNGTVLPQNSSERTLFEFGQSWALKTVDESYFPYFNGQTRTNYCNMSFVPVFVEDYKDNLLLLFKNNSSLMSSANKTCWNAIQVIYLSCMYDAAQLQSLRAASESTLAVVQEVSAKAVASNRAPDFNMPASITIHASTTFNISINVTDKDKNPFNLTVKEPSNETSVWLSDNMLVWRIGSNWNSTNLTITATDSVGAQSAWRPTLLYCDCLNGAACSFNYTTTSTAAGATFYKGQCICPSGYQGSRCEVSPCLAQPSPCYNRLMCLMHPNGSYYCSSCPPGMVGDGRTCEDLNECLEYPGICQDQCTNLVPGYRCNCTIPGFKVSSTNNTRCEDIDECATGDNKCRANQTCLNKNGSYDCLCPLAGYELNALYECQDIDECRAATNPCSEGICVNLPGRFKCACAYGKVLVAGQCKDVVVVSGTNPGSVQEAVASNIIIIASVSASAAVILIIIITLVILRRKAINVGKKNGSQQEEPPVKSSATSISVIKL